MKQAAVNMDVLSNPENLKIISNVLKTNVSAATSIGPFFTPQLGRIYMDMLGLYRAVSGIISETIAREGTLYMIQLSFQCPYMLLLNRNNCYEDA
jgi:exportin-1